MAQLVGTVYAPVIVQSELGDGIGPMPMGAISTFYIAFEDEAPVQEDRQQAHCIVQ